MKQEKVIDEDPPRLLLHHSRRAAGAGMAQVPTGTRTQGVGGDLMRAQWHWPAGMPLCRPMDAGLWEVRSNLTGNRIARVLFCVEGSEMIALHGFNKKARKTSANDMEQEKQRMKDVTGS
jgi:phage-related protein